MKAQITIFIIIGFVMLIAVGITLYATSFIVTKAKVVKSDVKYFVDSCLKQASEKAFFNLGQNGGFFDETSARTVVSSEDKAFSVLITTPKKDVCPGGKCVYFANPPDYPWPSFPYDENNDESFVGYFGDSLLPTLNSMQAKLEGKTEVLIKQCVNNFNELKEQGVNVKINSAPNVTFVFSNFSHISQDKFTNIKLDWSLTEDAAGIKTKHKTFSVKLPIRFSTLHYYLEHVINKDVSDVSYVPDISDANMNVNIGYFDDFTTLTITDSLSKIFGEPYSFVFAREDRYPALWEFDMSKNFHVGTKMTIDGDMLLINDPCGDNTRILLKVSDADERDVSFLINDESSIQFRKPGQYNLEIAAFDSILKDFKIIPISVAVCI